MRRSRTRVLTGSQPRSRRAVLESRIQGGSTPGHPTPPPWVDADATRPGCRRGIRASVESCRLADDDREHVAGRQDEVVLAAELHLGAAVLRVDDLVADGDVERDAVAVV